MQQIKRTAQMKRLFLLLLLTASIISSAQRYTFKSTAYAYKYVNEYGYWTDWTDWQSSNVKITIDTDTSVLSIYSKTPQVYYLKDYLGKFEDERGGIQYRWIIRDNEYLKAELRLRKELSGNLQLYIEYSDAMWVYNIKKIY